MPKTKEAVKSKILNGPKVPREIDWVIRCMQHIDPKYSQIPVWLAAAGNQGVKFKDLTRATNLTKRTTVNALEILQDNNLVVSIHEDCTDTVWIPLFGNIQDASNDQGKGLILGDTGNSGILGKLNNINNKRYYIYVIYNIYDTKNITLTLGSLRNKFPEYQVFCMCQKGFSNENPGCSNHLQAFCYKRVFEKEVSEQNETLKGKLYEEIQYLAPSNEIKSLEGKGGIPMVKSPRLRFSNDLKSEEKNKKEIRVGRNLIRYNTTPSKYPHLNNWKNHLQAPNRWKTLDWVGYWLKGFFECYGTDDPMFVGNASYKSMGRSKSVHGGKLDIYWLAALNIVKFRDAQTGMKGSGNELKRYLDWIFDEFVPGADWLDGPITYNQIVKLHDNWFLTKYRSRGITPKNAKPKPKGKWHHWGYSYE